MPPPPPPLPLLLLLLLLLLLDSGCRHGCCGGRGRWVVLL